MTDYYAGRTGGFVIAALWIAFILLVYAVMFHLAPRVGAFFKARQTAGETAETPEEDDLCAVAEAVAEPEERTEESNTMADFVLWDAAMDERPGVHRYMRRLERGSR